jgi:D-alanyl-lipoteichoic acid acyltransferase DltB (MBOAT superfamily)
VVVYSLYWAVGSRNRRTQNGILLVSSYLFYGLWDWRFLILLAGSTLIDYLGARAIYATQSRFWKKFYLWHNVLWNIGILVLFKYFDFFLRSFYALWGENYASGSFNLLDVIIPVGLSFYTFQTLSYTIDVYRGKLAPTNNVLDFMCFVSFFPQLVAGPIERAGKLLPQIGNPRQFIPEKQTDGLRLILWGLFKKVVIADSLGLAVDVIFAEPEQFGFMTLAYGAFLFACQLYCDFSGYTDIALGTAKLFGIELSENFKHPYRSRSFTLFWRRWHITMTRWFMDYVFIPVNKILPWSRRANIASATLITMLLIGLWHGANWTFIVFGLIHGLVLIGESIKISPRKRLQQVLESTPYLSKIYLWAILCGSLVFFRSPDISSSITYFGRIMSFAPEPSGVYSIILSLGRAKIFILYVLIEVLIGKRRHPFLLMDGKLPRPVKWLVYYLFIYWIFEFYVVEEQFIYFQF